MTVLKRATILQAAVLAVLAGLLFILAGSAPRQPRPTPVTSWRPATELERREQDKKLLEEEMDRIWREWQHQSPRP